MMKVLIVEDELPTARHIAKLVEQHPSFSVAAVEINGERALQFLRANQVDLIISDIQMPLMDGLQLLEVVHREFPDCLTVMLSGFSYFEYAKTALQLRAFDYLLKPIDNQTFFQMLSHAEEARKERDWARTHTFLGNALSGKPVQDGGQTYPMILAAADGAFWERIDRSPELLQDCHVFHGAADGERILIPAVDHWNPECLLLYGHRLDLVCTTDRICLSALCQTVNRLRSVRERQARLFQGNLICVNSRQTLPTRRVKLLWDMHPERAVQAICTQNGKDLRECLGQMWQVAAGCGYLRQDTEDYLSAILMDSRVSQQMPTDKLRRTKEQLQDILRTADDPETCTAPLADILLSLLRDSSAKRDVTEIVEEIAQYLSHNFHMPITTEDLAKRYGFVPQYLNRIFKKQKGVRPAEYLLNLRIQQARQMLESTPDILVKDVAASVGYSNHHYFSKVFHRATGHWPTEVQQSAKQK